MTTESPDSGDVFEIDRIRQIVELMEQHALSEVDLQQGKDRIKLTRGVAQPIFQQPPSAPAIAAPSPSVPAPVTTTTATASETAGSFSIKSPMVGTFYGRPNPESEPFVKVGTVLSEDTVICIIEAMKVFNEIPAECRGRVIEVLVKDNEPVDFGKPLFRVQVDG